MCLTSKTREKFPLITLECSGALGYFKLHVHLGLCMTAFSLFLTYPLHAAIIPSKIILSALSSTQTTRMFFHALSSACFVLNMNETFP